MMCTLKMFEKITRCPRSEGDAEGVDICYLLDATSATEAGHVCTGWMYVPEQARVVLL